MVFRYARHTDNYDAIIDFYSKLLGLEILFSFDEHNGYKGVFFGKKGENWHLEFTSSDTKAEHSFDEDDILVFYPKELQEYQGILERIKKNALSIIPSKNPYWNENGHMILDPDGFRVVISGLEVQNR